MPAQSDDFTHALVHQRPLHVSPVSQAGYPEPQGSPIPDSSQIGQSRVRQDVSSWRVETAVGNCCPHAVMHDAPPTQSSSQLRRFVQSVLFWHSTTSEQQLALAHTPHCEPPAVTEQSPPSAPPSPPDEPPTTVVVHLPPSTGMQSPDAAGSEVEEHATIAANTQPALARRTLGLIP
jgi:hypothetical protein